MTLASEIVAVSNSTKTLLTPTLAQEVAYEKTLTISIQNLDGTANIYVGNQNVTTSSYGLKMIPGDVVSLTVNPFEFIYAVKIGRAHV